MKSIRELKRLLSLSEVSKSENYFDYFKRIAEILMNKCVISKGDVNYEKGDVNYEIVEIEFYLFTSDHHDVITYPRKLSAGQWFFHQSGVDLTFESNKEHFGGILIRGVRNIYTGKLVLGPQKCVNLLWDKASAFDIRKNEYPTIVEYSGSLNNKIQSIPRWIPVNRKIEREKGTTNAQIDRIISIIRNAEKKAVETNLQDEIKEEYSLVSHADLNEAMKLTYSRLYRFIKYDLINSTPNGWNGYSAKPKR